MEPMTVGEIAQVVGGRLLGGEQDGDILVSGVDTDSRKVRYGSLFVPFVGERTDGHFFINAALEQGAVASLTQRELEEYLPGKCYILVPDTLKAVQALAAHYRGKFAIPCVAVTGSVGKTTTKDMTASVLGERFHVLKTQGNYNNALGVPLTLFELNSSHEIMVIEMGMSHLGEISELTKLARPDVALITNVGDAHIENLGSRENTLKAKCEIFEGMRGGLAVLNGDDPLLRTLEGTLPLELLFCGEGTECAYQAEKIQEAEDHMGCVLQTPRFRSPVEIPAPGRHMIYPALMAAAVGEHFGLTQEEILRGIADFVPTAMRMNLIRRGNGITILNDTYNANPQSMRAAVDILSHRSEGNRVAVLGDMFELGALAPVLHAGVGEFLGRSGVECLIAVGELSRSIYDAALQSGIGQAYYCETKEQAKAVLPQVLRPNSAFLFKASRGMALEELVEELLRLTPEEKQSD